VPCDECTSTGQGVIPLFAVPTRTTAEKRPADVAPIAHTQDAKKALTSLKRTLLARHPASTPSPASYVDRSTRRRAMHPTSQFDSPGVPSPRSSSPGPTKSSHEPSRTPSVSTEEQQPSVPLPEHNVGRQLLLKQGWQPGTALGSATDDGLVEPIEVHPTAHRAGLGMRQNAVEMWRDNNGRDRMYASVRTSSRD